MQQRLAVTATAAAKVLQRKRSEGSDNIRAVLGTRRAGSAALLKWAERRRDNAIDAAATTSAHIMEAADNEALHAYNVVHTAKEARSTVKGSNGLEAWRKLKNIFDPDTGMNQIGAQGEEDE